MPLKAETAICTPSLVSLTHARYSMPLPVPLNEAEGGNPPPIPIRSPKRPPAGAVATAMVSGQGWMPIVGQELRGEEQDVVEGKASANNPYDLVAVPGSTVTASYPFHGDDQLQQLSFVVSQINIENSWVCTRYSSSSSCHEDPGPRILSCPPLPCLLISTCML